MNCCIFQVAFSGHRPSNSTGRTLAELRSVSVSLRDCLVELISVTSQVNGEVHLVVSVATGADQLAIEVAHNIGIPVHLLSPLAKDEFLKDFEEHDKANALNLIELSEKGFNGGSFREVNKFGQRPDCYAETNEELLKGADALITIWNGEPPRGVGGVADVWRSAEQNNLPRVHLNPVNNSREDYALDQFVK